MGRERFMNLLQRVGEAVPIQQPGMADAIPVRERTA